MHEIINKFSCYNRILGFKIVGSVLDPVVVDLGVVGARVEEDGLALNAGCWVAFSKVVLAMPSLSCARSIARVDGCPVDLSVEHGKKIGCKIASTGKAAESEGTRLKVQIDGVAVFYFVV